jgi:hypothetical protein
MLKHIWDMCMTSLQGKKNGESIRPFTSQIQNNNQLLCWVIKGKQNYLQKRKRNVVITYLETNPNILSFFFETINFLK